MDKINFKNDTAPYLNDETLMQLQDNIERAIDEKSSLPTGGSTGQILAKASNNDNDVEWVDQTGGEGGGTGDTLPIGATVEWHSNIIPVNWLLCNGQEVSRIDYAELFEVLGTTYGAGDETTTFNLPDFRDRVPVGYDQDDEDFNELGKTGGEKKHKLTISEMPSHTHAINTANSQGNLEWGYTFSYDGNNAGYNGIAQYVGDNNSHNNLQPHIVANFIIKAKQSAGLVATVVDSLDSDSATDGLSAKQGKSLNEKIKNVNTYSTEEINTGKMWIDGKTIYRKTLKVTDVSGLEYRLDLSELNIDTFFFDLTHSYYKWVTYRRQIPVINTNVEGSNVTSNTVAQNQMGIYYKYEEKKIVCEWGYQISNISEICITIEYTKTTD